MNIDINLFRIVLRQFCLISQDCYFIFHFYPPPSFGCIDNEITEKNWPWSGLMNLYKVVTKWSDWSTSYDRFNSFIDPSFFFFQCLSVRFISLSLVMRSWWQPTELCNKQILLTSSGFWIIILKTRSPPIGWARQNATPLIKFALSFFFVSLFRW